MIVFIPYFGSWPEWIDLFFDSVARNPSVHFLIYTDCGTAPYEDYANITIRRISFSDYIITIGKQLGLSLEPLSPYKLCDVRPFFGELHEREFADYDFYGWCDLDLVFGNIRGFYTDDILCNAAVLSTHADRISGHLARSTQSSRIRGCITAELSLTLAISGATSCICTS